LLATLLGKYNIQGLKTLIFVMSHLLKPCSRPLLHEDVLYIRERPSPRRSTAVLAAGACPSQALLPSVPPPKAAFFSRSL
jgi:hypothetical protein